MSLPSVVEAISQRPSILQAVPHPSLRVRPVALRQSNGNDDEDVQASLDDRHWEMFDQFYPPTRRASGQDLYLASTAIKDTAVIPIALFGPHVEYDALQDSDDSLADQVTRDYDAQSESSTELDMYASERDLGNDLAGRSGMIKQLVTSLYAGPEEASVEDEIIIHPPQSPSNAIASPASVSTVSNTMRPRRASMRLMSQATFGSGSNKDPIMMDEDEGSDDSGEEPEIVEPRGKRPRIGSKTTSSTVGSVGSKTTRKTTAGKSVARKATASKGRVGGKAPSKSQGRKRPAAN